MDNMEFEPLDGMTLDEAKKILKKVTKIIQYLKILLVKMKILKMKVGGDLLRLDY